jgi:hypothetical protein
VALGTKGVYDCPRGVEEVPAGVVVGVTFAGAAVGCSELGVAEEAVAGVGEEEVGVTTGAVRDWNIFAMSALLILAATGLAAGALEVVVVGWAGVVTGGVVAAVVVGVGGLADVDAVLPWAWLLLAAIEPKDFVTWGFRVGTFAGEEDTGADASLIDPKVTADPCFTVLALRWATLTPSLIGTPWPSMLDRREWLTEAGGVALAFGRAGEAARGEAVVGVVAVRGDGADDAGGPFAQAPLPDWSWSGGFDVCMDDLLIWWFSALFFPSSGVRIGDVYGFVVDMVVNKTCQQANNSLLGVERQIRTED